MAVETREDSIASDEHVVHFYEHDAQLVAAVGPYLLAAVQAGETAISETAIMIATEPHRRAIEATLTPTPVASPAIKGRPAADSSTERTVSAGFAPEPDAPAHARHLVANMLRRWGYDDRVVDDVTLIVSELTSNAVRHARSQFSLTVQVQERSTLHVAVADRAPVPSTEPDGGLVPKPLHGLGLIEALCSDWGIQRTAGGKIVWAQLTRGAPADTTRG
jgi:anti-sigma regulatory factor (Ser/Thr protein kinase)